jgi:hypothetical protein
MVPGVSGGQSCIFLFQKLLGKLVSIRPVNIYLPLQYANFIEQVKYLPVIPRH